LRSASDILTPTEQHFILWHSHCFQQGYSWSKAPWVLKQRWQNLAACVPI